MDGEGRRERESGDRSGEGSGVRARWGRPVRSAGWAGWLLGAGPAGLASSGLSLLLFFEIEGRKKNINIYYFFI